MIGRISGKYKRLLAEIERVAVNCARMEVKRVSLSLCSFVALLL